MNILNRGTNKIELALNELSPYELNILPFQECNDYRHLLVMRNCLHAVEILDFVMQTM